MTAVEIAATIIGAVLAGVPLVYVVGRSFSRGFHDEKRRFVRELMGDATERKD